MVVVPERLTLEEDRGEPVAIACSCGLGRRTPEEARAVISEGGDGPFTGDRRGR